jgi:hypothetical protein
MVRQQVQVDNKYRYHMDPAYAPPPKKVPLLKSTYSEPVGRPNNTRVLQSRG